MLHVFLGVWNRLKVGYLQSWFTHTNVWNSCCLVTRGSFTSGSGRMRTRTMCLWITHALIAPQIAVSGCESWCVTDDSYNKGGLCALLSLFACCSFRVCACPLFVYACRLKPVRPKKKKKKKRKSESSPGAKIPSPESSYVLNFSTLN